MSRVNQARAVTGSSSLVASSSAGGMLSITLSGATAASDGMRTHLTQIAFAAASPGSTQTLRVLDGTSSGAAIYELGVVSTGLGVVNFPAPLRGSANEPLTVVLSSGSAGLQTLTVLGFIGD